VQVPVGIGEGKFAETVTVAGVYAIDALLDDACSQLAGQFDAVALDAEILNSTCSPAL
jgi:hypothetical protein